MGAAVGQALLWAWYTGGPQVSYLVPAAPIRSRPATERAGRSLHAASEVAAQLLAPSAAIEACLMVKRSSRCIVIQADAIKTDIGMIIFK